MAASSMAEHGREGRPYEGTVCPLLSCPHEMWCEGKNEKSWLGWCMPMVLELGGQRQEDHSLMAPWVP